jgi:hypothetical protein
LGSNNAKDAFAAIDEFQVAKQAGSHGFSDLDTHTLAEVPEVFCRGWPGDQPVCRAELWSGSNGVEE